MTINSTNIIGGIFFLMGLVMFTAWLFMATKEIEIIGLKSWYIWGSLSAGTVLIVTPQDTAVGYIKALAMVAINWLKKK